MAPLFFWPRRGIVAEPRAPPGTLSGLCSFFLACPSHSAGSLPPSPQVKRLPPAPPPSSVERGGVSTSND